LNLTEIPVLGNFQNAFDTVITPCLLRNPRFVGSILFRRFLIDDPDSISSSDLGGHLGIPIDGQSFANATGIGDS
jgi:hypothetical protein